ncbi:MAG: hypothetical protein OXE99_11855 [Cellvibrionales bacterium]|nr:hypothetical protein [Cellvibrionales bacterium]
MKLRILYLLIVLLTAVVSACLPSPQKTENSDNHSKNAATQADQSLQTDTKKTNRSGQLEKTQNPSIIEQTAESTAYQNASGNIKASSQPLTLWVSPPTNIFYEGETVTLAVGAKDFEGTLSKLTFMLNGKTLS